MRVLARVHLPHPVWSVAVAGGSVWVSYRIGGKNATTGGIWQIDPQDLSIVRTLPLADNSINLIGAGGAICWYGSNLPALVRFDPATGERTRTRAYVFHGSVTPGDGSLWITDQGTGRVTRADLSTGRILHTWTMRQAESPATGPPFLVRPRARRGRVLLLGLDLWAELRLADRPEVGCRSCHQASQVPAKRFRPGLVLELAAPLHRQDELRGRR